jgi:GTP-binding protein
MDAEHIATAAEPEQFPPASLPEIAFLGRSNVGKSSLLNRLVDKQGLAFTSSRPGRTQTINFFRVEKTLYLVDLPGYGYAQVTAEMQKQWQRLIEHYLQHRETLRLCLILLDARRGWMDKDLELKRWLEFHQRQYLVVATKVDKLNQKEEYRGLKAIREQCAADGIVPFSAVTGRGVREIWQAIWKTKNQA